MIGPKSVIKRWLRTESGAATMEFVVMFPLIIAFLGAAVESGILSMRQAMLDRSVDLVSRELRLGQVSPTTQDEVRRRVCANAGLIPDCIAALNIELFTVAMDDWKFPNNPTKCADRDEKIKPAVEFKPGVENQLLVMRVCAAVQPLMPMAGLGLRLPRINKTDYAIYSLTALVNEPTS